MTTSMEEQAWLEGRSGTISGQRLSLQPGETLLGRGSRCHVQIKDPRISRTHASIRQEGDGYRITDLKSSHGTILNGERITTSLLKDGDVIILGETSLQFCLHQDAIQTVREAEPVPEAAARMAEPVRPVSSAAPPVVPPPPLPAAQRKSPLAGILLGCGGVVAIVALVSLAVFAFTAVFGREPDLDEAAARAILDDLAGGETAAPRADDPELPAQTEAPSTPTLDVSVESVPAALVIRPYNPETDASVAPLTQDAVLDRAHSTTTYGYYTLSWPAGVPALINTGWCAKDRETLDENFPLVRLTLSLDETEILLEELFFESREEETVACNTYRGVIENIDPGRHVLVDTYYYETRVSDGWSEVGPGTDVVEYEIEVYPGISVLDSFEEPTGNWSETIQSNFNLIQTDTSFEIEIFNQYFTAWSLYDDLVLDDAILLTAGARLSEEPGYYGIVFRYQDVNNFYYFRVDDRGIFEVGKRFEGEFIPLHDPATSTAILPDGAANKVAVTVEGDTFQAYINFEPVITVKDTTFGEGMAGMLASTPLDVYHFKTAFEYFSIDTAGIEVE
jgi:pSer/pThr/pTyr-binding forkhead associated (FHA) protein